tara:strand:+ start:3587 stop:3883 length:297 start_codon:yes stop_codon:yes gene_type:complete
MREPWLEYIIRFDGVDEIEKSFIMLRNELKKNNFKEEDLSSMSSGPASIFVARDSVISSIDSLRNDLKRYGLWDKDVNSNFDSYISRKLSKLEEEYPL